MTLRRRGRALTEEERALWEGVTAGVKRRAALRPAKVPVAEAAIVAPAKPAAKPAKVSSRVVKPVGRLEPAIALINAAPELRSGLDGKRAARLRKGELAIEARIDLHGMTLDVAHAALGGFLVQARGRGHRCVLVITGKGGPGREGALKQLVPRWLSEAPFGAMIADRATAQARHGGAGALYVYLRRKRA